MSAADPAVILTPAQFEAGLANWAARRLMAELVKVPEYRQFDLGALPAIAFVSVPHGDFRPLRVTLTITATAYEIVAPTEEDQ